MSRIEFVDIMVDPSGKRIDLTCIVRNGPETNKYELWFEFNLPRKVNHNGLALALSALCGSAYGEIFMELSPSADVVKSITDFTRAELIVPSIGDEDGVSVPSGGSHILSFSGGFDSLAALALMPKNTRLVSMDFGGKFARERLFFESFDPFIVSTNLTETPLVKNTWTFMGIAAILEASITPSQWLTFGNVVEATVDNVNINPASAANRTFPVFQAVGLSNAPYVLGLTEVGTLIVLLRHYGVDSILKSLQSLAGPGEEKLFRKSVLAHIVAGRLGMNLSPLAIDPPHHPHRFGQSFALDFLIFYIIKYSGRPVAESLLRDIPREVFEMADRLDLSFYEMSNTTLYSGFPAELTSVLSGNLASTGIHPYTEKDWHSFAEIRGFLASFHPAIK